MNLIENLLVDILDMSKEKILSHKCTEGDLKEWFNMFSEHLDSMATIEEIAQHYNQPEANVRNLISRRNIPEDKKPQRRVLYSFEWFSKQVPKSWRRQ